MTAPLGWHRPRRIFVNSMSDLFHERVPREIVAKIFGIMGYARQHTFQVLTKRAEHMGRVVGDLTEKEVYNAAGLAPGWVTTWPLPNVWLGVSVEDQQRVDTRLPWLIRTPAAVRFISAEPLLGPLRLQPWLACIDWVIVGGESGASARPMHPLWPISIRDQCLDWRVPLFFKQWGEYRPRPTPVRSPIALASQIPFRSGGWSVSASGPLADCSTVESGTSSPHQPRLTDPIANKTSGQAWPGMAWRGKVRQGDLGP